MWKRRWTGLWVPMIACLIATWCAGDEPDLAQQAKRIQQEQRAVADSLLADFPTSFTAQQILANVFKTQGNDEAFSAALRKCAQMAPQRSDVHDQLGRNATENDDFASAIVHFRKSLALRRDVSVMVRLADALVQTADFSAAEKLLKQAGLADKTGQAAYLLGEVHFQRDEVLAAKTAYEQALRQQPSHRNALYGMVKVATQLGDIPSAEQYSTKFERVQQLVSKLNQQRRKTYDDLGELKRHAAQTLTDAGQLYQRKKRGQRAAELWQRATELDATNVSCRHLLARHYADSQQHDKAVPLYRDLIQLQPKNLTTYERLGMRLATGGDFAGAENTFFAMTKVRSDPTRGYRMLAKLYLNTDQKIEEAVALARRSVKESPIADSYFVLGWALSKSNDVPNARKALERAMQLDDSKSIYRQLYRSLE